MVMRHTGKRTMKGYLSRKKIKFGFGIPIPRPFCLQCSNAKDSANQCCITLPKDEHVNGIYRDLETILIMLSQFYFQTDEFRKDNDKLNWFGSKKVSFKVAIGRDGAPL